MSYCVSCSSLRVRLAMCVVCCATGDWLCVSCVVHTNVILARNSVAPWGWSKRDETDWNNSKCFNVKKFYVCALVGVLTKWFYEMHGAMMKIISDVLRYINFRDVANVVDILPHHQGRYSSTLSLTSALDGVRDQRHAPAALPPVKTRCPLYMRLGAYQGRSGRVRKVSPPPGFDPRTVQPVASLYFDWAVPAHGEKY